MDVSIRIATSLALLLAIVFSQTDCFGQAAVKEAEIGARAKSAPAKPKNAAADAAPADALKAANRDAAAVKAEAEEEAKKRAADQAKLDFVAGGLRALFGGPMQAPQAIIAEEPADADLANDAMTQQFMMQLHPILKSELGFVRQICSDLTPEQRKKIRTPAEAALKNAAMQQARQQNRMQRGIAVRNTPTESGKVIRDAVHKALQETLTEPQFARFTQEAKRRTETRHRAAILSLVSRMDGQLYLTAEQREKITESLSTEWQDTWEKWLTMMNMYGDRYFPVVPDHCITKFLNKEQKLVWQNVQKVDFGAWWGGGQLQNLDNDGWWGDEPANKEAGFEGAVIINRVIGF